MKLRRAEEWFDHLPLDVEHGRQGYLRTWLLKWAQSRFCPIGRLRRVSVYSPDGRDATASALPTRDKIS